MRPMMKICVYMRSSLEKHMYVCGKCIRTYVHAETVSYIYPSWRGTCYVSQASLKLVAMLLPMPLESWCYWSLSPCPARNSICGCFYSFETLSHVFQAGLKFVLYLRMTLNSWPSCLYLPNAGITGILH